MELFLLWFILGMVAALIADRKGGSGCLWFILGFLFGPFALIAALFVTGKRCPYCKKGVHVDATVCPYCQRDLPPEEKEPPHKLSGKGILFD